MRCTLTPLFILWFLLLPALGLAQDLSCPGLSKVEVPSGNKENIVEICLAAEQAVTFLSNYNLVLKHKIVVEIVDIKIITTGSDAYGSYDSRSDLVQLMSYDAILKAEGLPLMYGEPFDRVHYTGAIAHEVAHAISNPGPQAMYQRYLFGD